MRTKVLAHAGLGLAIVILPLAASAQEPIASTNLTEGASKTTLATLLEAESYVAPPTTIADFINAPRHENYILSNLSPDKKVFLITESAGMPSVNEMGKPWLNLAGVQVDPKAFRARSMTTGGALGYTLFDWKTEKKTPVEVPVKGARVGSAVWSPDGSKLAFLVHTEDATMLAVADCANGRSRLVTKTPLLATQVTRPEWTADGKSLFAVFVPDKKIAPAPLLIATQPHVRMSEPSKNPTRTFREASLLSNMHDQEMFEAYITGQLAKVDASSGRMERIGEPKMYRSIDPSPDGKYVRVTTTLKPFSYIVQASSFGSLEQVVDLTGKELVMVSRRPLRIGSGGGPADPTGFDPTGFDPDQAALAGYDWADREFMVEQRGGGQGRGGGRFGQAAGGGGTGRRGLGWAPDGNGMIFLQVEPLAGRRNNDDAEEQGSQEPAPRNRKDRVMRWSAPFGRDDAKPIYEVEGTISSAQFGSDGKTLFVTENSGTGSTTYAVDLSDTTKKVAILTQRGGGENAGVSGGPGGGRPGAPAAQASDNFYDNPGNWVTKSNENGVSTIWVSSKNEVFLSGTEYNKDPDKVAPRPFFDAVSLADGKKRRIWQSSADVFESISAYLDDEGAQVVMSRQSPTMIANSYLASTAGGEVKSLTKNTDYIPAVTGAQRDRIQITRPDGFKFWVEVTTPAGWKKGDRLPAFFWFYPREYTDQATYDRQFRTRNKNTFPAVGSTSKDLLILFGYAVVEPDCPIVGPTGRMNDSYVPDLRANLYATINELDKQGYIDRDKLGIGGHSYGAFSTANAMVYTPFFKAGIAGDGAYNRMLTPMSFQSETRQLWEARETYLTMSPLLYAEQITGALLMYHGEADQNVGTDPINSERMFHALDGLGKTVSMYMYPYEDHGQVAKETILDQWARWIAWLDKYVKGEK